MDNLEPTPWDEINPPMASAQQPEQQSPSLVPASNEQFRNELTACLALVVPVGMTEEARREWLSVAWATLGHLPPDMLAEGCKQARAKADHPSKIVPAIIAATEDWMALRRKIRDSASHVQRLPPPPKHVMDRRGEPMNEADTAELNRILDLNRDPASDKTVRYRTDGSRYTVAR